MINPVHRLDQPTDYGALWNGLKRRLNDLRRDYAEKAASERDETEIRKHQGAYAAMNVVESEMDQLLDQARTEKRAS
jgi:hypothetical protein